MAPVVKALEGRPEVFDTRVCLTAQHRGLLDQVIALFGLRVDHDLDLMAPGQALTDITTGVLHGVGEVIADENPGMVLIHGDTTTSFATALAAYYQRVPVAHVEAGLRTGDKFQPYPEEMNRRLSGALCDYHYAPTEGAKANLLAEHVPEDRIVLTGNTAIDALLSVASLPHTFDDPALEALGSTRRLILVTAHRRENFGAPFVEMCGAMGDIVDRNPDVELVYPVHPNPNVREVVDKALRGRGRVHLIEPQDYLSFVQLQKKAHLILTDSGGIQEEAPSLGKPVLVMRETTERPEAVRAGVTRLVGSNREQIAGEVQRLLDDPGSYAAMARAENPFGDGRASERIVAHLASLVEDTDNP